MTVPPNVRHVDEFVRLQQLAREAGEGLWGLDPSTKDPSDPEPLADPQDADGDIIVYITRTGSKYHRAGCRHLNQSMIPIKLSEALKRYEPCKFCRPPGR